jgi:hypothetical protein
MGRSRVLGKDRDLGPLAGLRDRLKLPRAGRSLMR